jgi:hypothetical protein
MKEYSDITQRWYEPDECVFYKNGYQAAFMLSHPDVVLYDIFESDGKLVFVFSRNAHRKYINIWRTREHDYGGYR